VGFLSECYRQNLRRAVCIVLNAPSVSVEAAHGPSKILKSPAGMSSKVKTKVEDQWFQLTGWTCHFYNICLKVEANDGQEFYFC
jgi:hypothetical protein